jgi:hypothetical protein
MDTRNPGSELSELRQEVIALRQRLDNLETPSGATRARRSTTPARWRRPLTIVAVVAMLAALPLTVSASHSFTDVPDSNTFHLNIGNLYGARITTGCTATTYCPDAGVTRGQMAAFLNRGLGRMAFDTVLLPDDWTELGDEVFGSVTLRTGGATGGTGYALVSVDIGAYTNENGICPCEIRVWLTNSATSDTSLTWFAPILSEIAWDGYRDGTLSLHHAFVVPSGTNVTFTLGGSILSSLAPSPEFDSEAYYSINAVYVPFDSVGGNPVIPGAIAAPATGRVAE